MAIDGVKISVRDEGGKRFEVLSDPGDPIVKLKSENVSCRRGRDAGNVNNNIHRRQIYIISIYNIYVNFILELYVCMYGHILKSLLVWNFFCIFYVRMILSNCSLSFISLFIYRLNVPTFKIYLQIDSPDAWKFWLSKLSWCHNVKYLKRKSYDSRIVTLI